MNENNFFSIDRLVEFGMGMTIAQQMVKSMNEAMNNMTIAGVNNAMEKPQEKFFYAMLEGKQTGPFSEQELSRLIAEKKITKETYLWYPSLQNWQIAEQIPEVLKLVALTPPSFEVK